MTSDISMRERILKEKLDVDIRTRRFLVEFYEESHKSDMELNEKLAKPGFWRSLPIVHSFWKEHIVTSWAAKKLALRLQLNAYANYYQSVTNTYYAFCEAELQEIRRLNPQIF